MALMMVTHVADLTSYGVSPANGITHLPRDTSECALP